MFSPAGILKSQNRLACHVRGSNHTHAMWTFSFPCPKGKGRIFIKKHVFPPLNGPFFELREPISINFGFLESPKRLLNAVVGYA